MEEDLILDEEEMEEHPSNLWAWLRLEGLLGLAIISGYYSFGLDPRSWEILAIGSLGYLVLYFIIPYKRKNLPESNWFWVVFSGIALGIFITGFAFKLMLWPGAGLLITLGSFLISVAYLSFSIYLFFIRQISIGLKMSLMPLGFMFPLAFIAILFRTMLWPMAGFLCFLSVGVSSLILSIYILLLIFQWKEFKILRFYLLRILVVMVLLAFLAF